ncbi:MAG: S8/S53 family peptidase [Ferruginibacter sp.]
MRKIIYCSLALVFLFSCKKTSVTTEEKNNKAPELISSTDIDAFIKDQLSQHEEFLWSSASDEMVWSALQQSDNIMSVGYKPANANNIENNIQNININSADWKAARDKVLQMILQSEQELDATLTLKSIQQWDETVLPVIDVTVKNYATVKLLRASNLIRYAEPMGYQPKDATQQEQKENAIASSSGCDGNPAETGLVAGVDYTTITPACKQSWNHSYHKITQAWTKSTGAGTKIFVVDTGCEFDQDNLGSAFNQGSSTGRTVEKIVTLPRNSIFGIQYGTSETPDDGCGHGTCMAGACAAPRGIDGAACGIAYNCNLVTCRAAEDVFLDASREVKGVSDAFTNAGNRADVKIISMSMGSITSSSQITDAINYAYGKGKLIFCAAGTSFGWSASWFGVIFPATLSNVNAVTGVRDNNFNTTCTDCHNGSQTDFTIVMERASNGGHPITLASSGDVPSTVGGSSVSTSQAAGIAALVWSRFPTYTRDQVLNKLIQTSANYPTKSSSLGWGNLNADAATN